MLTFMGLSFPNNPVRDRYEAPLRAAKLKYMADYFHTAPAVAFYMLDDDALATSNPDRGKSLVINSHGNPRAFARYTPREFLDLLIEKGFEEGSFKAIYLMACKTAFSPEDTGVMTNFAMELKLLLLQIDRNCKLYGTRGNLSYDWDTHDAGGGQVYFEMTDMFIKSPTVDGHRYTMEQGMLLATAS